MALLFSEQEARVLASLNAKIGPDLIRSLYKHLLYIWFFINKHGTKCSFDRPKGCLFRSTGVQELHPLCGLSRQPLRLHPEESPWSPGYLIEPPALTPSPSIQTWLDRHPILDICNLRGKIVETDSQPINYLVDWIQWGYNSSVLQKQLIYLLLQVRRNIFIYRLWTDRTQTTVRNRGITRWTNRHYEKG